MALKKLIDLPIGTSFELTCTGKRGVLLDCSDAWATVEIHTLLPAREWADKWGKRKTRKAGISKGEPTMWSAGTKVRVVEG